VDTDVSSCAWDHNGGLIAVFGKSMNIIDPRKKEVALVSALIFAYARITDK
jgi:hypothetical protein